MQALPRQVTAQPLKASKALGSNQTAFHAFHLHFVQVSGLHELVDAIRATTRKPYKALRRKQGSANHIRLSVGGHRPRCVQHV